MSLVFRVVIMAFCVMAAFALPNFGKTDVAEENAILKAIISQLQNTLIYSKLNNNSQTGLNNTQDICTLNYSKQVNEINIATVNQTQACYEYANKTLKSFNKHKVNSTTQSVLGMSKELQTSLENCSVKNSSQDIFNCFVYTFDKNLENLNNITLESQVAISAISGFENQVRVERQICVGRVLIASKTNSTLASNQMMNCLANSTLGILSSPRLENQNTRNNYYLN